MSDNKTWTQQEVFALIKNWKAHPALWDPKHRGYRVRGKKQEALQAIAAELKTPENELYRKFHNLRTQFHQELRRIKTKRSIDGGDTIKPSWKFFGPMSFILDQATLRELNYSPPETKIEDFIIDDTENLEIEDTCVTPEFVEIRRNPLNIEERESICLLRNPLQVGDKVVDEFQVFGDFVASELRSLRSRDNQNKLKRMIQHAILEISEIDDF